MHNPNQLIPELVQQSKLPELSQFIENPWYLHFATLWMNTSENCDKMVKHARVPDFSAAVIREQTIGESRAFELCAEGPKKLYDKLVSQKQTTQEQ